jgi:soluble lytic murein transglycosylase-like protein
MFIPLSLRKMTRAACIILAPGLQAAAPANPNPSPKPAAAPASVFEQEQAMSPAKLVQRWKAPVAKAARRTGVPVAWINAVMRVESGGRTMLSENMRMVSDKGAMGIMQLMPQTYAQMRAQYRLGPDPFNPQDNIQAGSAYLRWLKGKYPYPALFAAYNAGPQRVDELLAKGTPLPDETRAYVARIGSILNGAGGRDGASIMAASLTRPDGSVVLIDPLAVRSIRAVLPGEYAPGVQSVVRLGGRLSQGVHENVATATAAIRIHGGRI